MELLNEHAHWVVCSSAHASLSQNINIINSWRQAGFISVSLSNPTCSQTSDSTVTTTIVTVANQTNSSSNFQMNSLESSSVIAVEISDSDSDFEFIEQPSNPFIVTQIDSESSDSN